MEGIGELLARARADDQQAWESLHLSLQPHMLGQAQQLIGPSWRERSIPDLIQETWLKAWRKLDRFVGGPDDRQTAAMFRAWLKRIMTNHYRNLNRTPKPPISGGSDLSDSSCNSDGNIPGRELTASKCLSQTEEQIRVRQALVRLPELERTIIRMYVLEGVTMPEIARELELSFDEVRYHKDKGLRLLGEDLGGSP